VFTSSISNEHRDDDDIPSMASAESEQQEEYEVRCNYHQITFPEGVGYLFVTARYTPSYIRIEAQCFDIVRGSKYIFG
jgi:hypothetical protein